MYNHKSFVCAAAAMLLTAGFVMASDWPQWRGPARSGVSAESSWMDHWPAAGPSIAWKAQVGLGFSSFVVANGRVVTVGHADEKDTVFCCLEQKC